MGLSDPRKLLSRMGLNPMILGQVPAFALAVSPSEPPAVLRRGYRASGFAWVDFARSSRHHDCPLFARSGHCLSKPEAAFPGSRLLANRRTSSGAVRHWQESLFAAWSRGLRLVMKRLGFLVATIGLSSLAPAADLPTQKAWEPSPTRPDCFSSQWTYLSSSASDCRLTYPGVTLYGTLDGGYGYETHGVPLNPSADKPNY